MSDWMRIEGKMMREVFLLRNAAWDPSDKLLEENLGLGCHLRRVRRKRYV